MYKFPLNKILLFSLLAVIIAGGAYAGFKSWGNNIKRASFKTQETSQAIISGKSISSTTPEKIIKLNINDVKGWKKYKNETINITFNYPDDWIVNESDSKYSVIFTNEDSSARILLRHDYGPTGFEGYNTVKAQYFSTNKADIKLHYTLLKFIDKNSDSYSGLILWETNRKDNNNIPLSDIFMLDFNGANIDYYQYVIDNIAKTFRFIE